MSLSFSQGNAKNWLVKPILAQLIFLTLKGQGRVKLRNSAPFGNISQHLGMLASNRECVQECGHPQKYLRCEANCGHICFIRPAGAGKGTTELGKTMAACVRVGINGKPLAQNTCLVCIETKPTRHQPLEAVPACVTFPLPLMAAH